MHHHFILCGSSQNLHTAYLTGGHIPLDRRISVRYATITSNVLSLARNTKMQVSSEARSSALWAQGGSFHTNVKRIDIERTD